VFWLSTIGLTLIAWGTAPFAGLMASFYTHEDDVKEVVKILIWLNAAFMPIWAASWVLPAGLKGARDARFAMWVSMLGMWGCRVVAGYTLGVMLGWGWSASGWGCSSTGPCGARCSTGGWSAGAGCGNIREKCLTIARSGE
jgi:Na+-driven multidrug efflux pump